MVLAILGVPDVALIESDRRKAQFLREVARATGTAVAIHGGADRAPARHAGRAWSPPARSPPCPACCRSPSASSRQTASAFSSKGAAVADELTAARESWHMVPEMFPSLSAPSGVVLKLRGVAPCA